MKSNHKKIIRLKTRVSEDTPENEMIHAMSTLLNYIDRRIENFNLANQSVKNASYFSDRDRNSD
ncbi:MAG: hypothetical protein HKN76_03865 [Saprospiraceae bacterium]|nr:hypothetical protein [Saprospiraceae bacterium]